MGLSGGLGRAGQVRDGLFVESQLTVDKPEVSVAAMKGSGVLHLPCRSNRPDHLLKSQADEGHSTTERIDKVEGKGLGCPMGEVVVLGSDEEEHHPIDEPSLNNGVGQADLPEALLNRVGPQSGIGGVDEEVTA